MASSSSSAAAAAVAPAAMAAGLQYDSTAAVQAAAQAARAAGASIFTGTGPPVQVGLLLHGMTCSLASTNGAQQPL